MSIEDVTDDMIHAFEAASGRAVGRDSLAGIAAVLAIVKRDRRAAITQAAAEKRPTQEMVDAYCDVAPSGQVSIWGLMAAMAVADAERQATP